MLARAQSTLKNVNLAAMPRILSFLVLKTCGRSWANFYFLVVNFFNKKEKKIRHFWKFWKKNPRHSTVFTINRTEFEECLFISLGLRSTKSWGACYNRKKWRKERQLNLNLQIEISKHGCLGKQCYFASMISTVGSQWLVFSLFMNIITSASAFAWPGSKHTKKC